ncbi:hypothetical protein PR048_018615 [Dryococelus australis]|uniref:DDE-1 domain-containing protein n=1 Tax=Dryococelus australis TaxID=614101 RepID=A0ABQ9HCZ6_9NEOP|nr:hypothetical protein PR048_018615 [Dryococelus australis]
MEQRRNERVGEMGDPQENQLANCIVRHDFYMQKCGVTRPGIKHGSPCRLPQLGDGARVYNLDETGFMTVQKQKNIIAQKGVKQVNQCTSGEKGQLVTVVSTNTNSSKENPSILICDYHESHFSLMVLDMAKEAGITILTLPPHTSNKLQPLDLTVFAPFKGYNDAAVDMWMLKHPGTLITIYQVAECGGEAYMKAMMPTSIVGGFRRAGIVPFNESFFTDVDFLLSQVTDRPEPPESCKQGSTCESPNFEETTNEVVGRPTSNRSMQDDEEITTNEVAERDSKRKEKNVPKRKVSRNVFSTLIERERHSEDDDDVDVDDISLHDSSNLEESFD